MNSGTNFTVAILKLERFAALARECNRQKQAVRNTEEKMRSLYSGMTPYEKSVCETVLARLMREQRAGV